MEIKYDNLLNPSNYITLTDIPNILEITEDGYGEKALVQITVLSGLKGSTTSDYQWKVTFMGETITNVLSANEAINKYFSVMTSPNDTATSMARALRNCPTISANFIVQSTGATVNLVARKEGAIFTDGIAQHIENNIPSNLLTLSATDGYMSPDDLYNAKIDVEVYNDGEYVTMLEKNFYNGKCYFNLSPVLTTFARLGYAEPYTLQIYSYRNGVLTNIGNIPENYISVGYMVNQGAKVIDNSILNIAQNISRGKERDVDNNTVLYIYGNSIPISFYRGNDGAMTITTEYKDSSYNTIRTESTTWRNTYSAIKLIDLEIPLTNIVWNDTFYVDLTLGSKTIRYNVIKPLLATEYSQRICFRNSYGGISFIDLSGKMDASNKTDTSTYQKNIYNYYSDEINQLNRTYDINVTQTITLKSHIFERDGKWIYNDLMQSPAVWTTINGEKYMILIDSVSVDEVNNNDCFEATVSFHLSQPTTLV